MEDPGTLLTSSSDAVSRGVVLQPLALPSRSFLPRTRWSLPVLAPSLSPPLGPPLEERGVLMLPQGQKVPRVHFLRLWLPQQFSRDARGLLTARASPRLPLGLSAQSRGVVLQPLALPSRSFLPRSRWPPPALASSLSPLLGPPLDERGLLRLPQGQKVPRERLLRPRTPQHLFCLLPRVRTLVHQLGPLRGRESLLLPPRDARGKQTMTGRVSPRLPLARSGPT